MTMRGRSLSVLICGEAFYGRFDRCVGFIFKPIESAWIWGVAWPVRLTIASMAREWPDNDDGQFRPVS